MIRKYEKNRIYVLFKVTEMLSAVSLIFSIITVLLFVIQKYAVDLQKTVENGEFLFYSFALLTPIIMLMTSTSGLKIPCNDDDQKQEEQPTEPKAQSLLGKSTIKESKFYNDFTNTLCAAIFSLSDVILVLFLLLIGLVFGSTDFAALLFLLKVLLPHILVYIGACLLICNSIFIRLEWKKNPPLFIQKQQQEKIAKQYKIEMANLQKQKEEEYALKMQKYKSSIEQCGMKFFIKYYPQIKRLPLRDVTVEENYTPIEKEERLKAVKQIIDNGLTEFALSQILKEYSDMLSEDEIVSAKKILQELQQ